MGILREVVHLRGRETMYTVPLCTSPEMRSQKELAHLGPKPQKQAQGCSQREVDQLAKFHLDRTRLWFGRSKDVQNKTSLLYEGQSTLPLAYRSNLTNTGFCFEWLAFCFGPFSIMEPDSGRSLCEMRLPLPKDLGIESLALIKDQLQESKRCRIWRNERLQKKKEAPLSRKLDFLVRDCKARIPSSNIYTVSTQEAPKIVSCPLPCLTNP